MLNILETTRLVCGLIFYAYFVVRGCGGFECHASHSRTENENKSFRRLSGGTNLLVGDYENINYKDFRYINN